ncbi:MAG TPA: type 4a pilus biogenesis protein PilO [Candidatus Dojkabacteria bacterium]
MALEFRNKQLSKILETEQGKTYAVFGGTVFIVIIMFVFAIRPAWLSITDKLAENDVKRQYIDAADEKLSTLDNLSTQYIQNESSIDYLNAYYLPEEKAQSFIVKNITEITNKIGLEVSSINFDRQSEIPEEVPFTNAGLTDAKPIVFTVRGELDQIESLTGEIENFGRTIHISTISIGSVETESGGFIWQASFRCYYYYWFI